MVLEGLAVAAIIVVLIGALYVCGSYRRQAQTLDYEDAQANAIRGTIKQENLDRLYAAARSSRSTPTEDTYRA